MHRETIITRVSEVDARSETRGWPWADVNRDAISANWQQRIAAKPQMFNGRVLLLGKVSVTPQLCRSTYFETEYANLVGWIDLEHPDPSVANGFAMGALRGSDGAFICGVMADHTANAGRVYFAAGTPDRSDLRADGSVDLAGSLTRELIEETGLHETDYTVSDEWIVVERWPTVAMMRLVNLDVPAEQGAARIKALIARQREPELKDLRIVRSPDDIDPGTMPLFLQSFFRWSFDQR
jgi:8-oxo-dGTP pyrophosphatase MutT (NUDIX family)